MGNFILNDYRRFISYVYNYYQEKKEQNIGFLKVEKRGNHVKMQGNFRVRPRSDMGENYQLYMLVTEEQQWSRIPADCMQKKGNVMEIYLETEADNVLQSGFKAEQTAGIQIVNEGKPESQYFLASLWVNESPNWSEFSKNNIQNHLDAEEMIDKNEMGETKEDINNNIRESINTTNTTGAKGMIESGETTSAKGEQEKEENYTSSIVQLLEDYVNQEELTEQSCELTGENSKIKENELKESEIKDNEIKDSEIKNSEIKNSEIKESEIKRESGEDDASKSESYSQNDSEQEEYKELEKLWQNWRKLYCKCQIPFNDTVLNGIKIQLSDLERFPSNCWGFAGNPFVLHGYYYFRYLVFAKDSDGKFYIGVPGVYHDREKMAAALFGFGNFAKMPPQKGVEGDFGYWLHCIE